MSIKFDIEILEQLCLKNELGESFIVSNVLLKKAMEDFFAEPNNYSSWLNMATHFGGTSSTNSKIPFICYQKAVELSGNNVHACYKVIFDFYNNTKDYDKNIPPLVTKRGQLLF
jgi:hypothetical protein